MASSSTSSSLLDDDFSHLSWSFASRTLWKRVTAHPYNRGVAQHHYDSESWKANRPRQPAELFIPPASHPPFTYDDNNGTCVHVAVSRIQPDGSSKRVLEKFQKATPLKIWNYTQFALDSSAPGPSKERTQRRAKGQLRDPPAPWWYAQLIHYGLHPGPNANLTKAVAKQIFRDKIVMDFTGSPNLVRPPWILAIEDRLILKFQHENLIAGLTRNVSEHQERIVAEVRKHDENRQRLNQEIAAIKPGEAVESLSRRKVQGVWAVSLPEVVPHALFPDFHYTLHLAPSHTRRRIWGILGLGVVRGVLRTDRFPLTADPTNGQNTVNFTWKGTRCIAAPGLPVYYVRPEQQTGTLTFYAGGRLKGTLVIPEVDKYKGQTLEFTAFVQEVDECGNQRHHNDWDSSMKLDKKLYYGSYTEQKWNKALRNDKWRPLTPADEAAERGEGTSDSEWEVDEDHPDGPDDDLWEPFDDEAAARRREEAFKRARERAQAAGQWFEPQINEHGKLIEIPLPVLPG